MGWSAALALVYCASKWAMEGFTKAAAIELGPLGVRVNTICPTFIETPLTRPFFADSAFLASVLKNIKLGRLGQLEESWAPSCSWRATPLPS